MTGAEAGGLGSSPKSTIQLAFGGYKTYNTRRPHRGRGMEGRPDDSDLRILPTQLTVADDSAPRPRYVLTVASTSAESVARSAADVGQLDALQHRGQEPP